MLFTKSAPVVSRSTFAAQSKSKKFWGSSNQASPGFFVSTPQFNRHQQNQITYYVEDGRGAGSSGQSFDSFTIENPYLPLTAGVNAGPAASVGLVDDDGKEEVGRPSKLPSERNLMLTMGPRMTVSDLTPRVVEITDDKPAAARDEIKVDPIALAVDKTDKLELVNSVLRKMHRLLATGSYSAVLETFEDLESLQANLPLEAYNMVLQSLASTGDANAFLEGYERLLARGLIPNETTYAIIMNGLADVAVVLSNRLVQLEPLLGNGSGILESVDEIREGLSVEDHLALALTIIEPVVASHPKPLHLELQLSLDRIISLCIEHNVAIPRGLMESASGNVVGTIALQPSIGAAAAEFSSLRPDLQQTEGAQLALMGSYFHFNEPAGAMAFFSSCGAPQYLLKPLLSGLASAGLVGISRKWVTELKPHAGIISSLLKSIPSEKAKEVLPSATEIFFQLVGRGGGGGGAGSGSSASGISDANEGRCSFMRLCVAAEDTEALLMAMRESKYSDVTWDANTISEVVQYMVKVQQPLLAADICAWQLPRLAELYSKNEVRSFVEEELISDTVRYLRKSDQLSLDAALRLLPVVLICAKTRKEILDIIFAAKLGAPHEVATLVNSENLPDIVRSLASLLISTSLRGTREEIDLVTRILPLFVEDAMAFRAEFSRTDLGDVHQALKMCKNSESLISLWLKRSPCRNETPKNEARSSEMSLNIARYARAPNGFDYALSILKDQLRLKVPVSASAIESVIEAAAQTEPNTLPEIFAIVPKTQMVVNSMCRSAATTGFSDLALQCYRILTQEIGVLPTLPTYHALIGSLSVDQALALFEEAQSRLPLNAEIYNTVATILAQNGRKQDLASLMAEMSDRKLGLFPQTYGHIINMSIKLNEGHQALAILKNVPTTVKSLLDVKVFNQLMNYFVKAGDRDSALEVFVELRNTGTLATTFTYRLLMSAYLIRNKSEEPNLNNADRVLSLMRHDGSPIPAQCFATLLHARGVLFKDFEGAINFYRGMVKNSRVLPDKSVFEALVESYVTNGRETELSAVLNEMKRYHVAVDGNIAKLAANP